MNSLFLRALFILPIAFFVPLACGGGEDEPSGNDPPGDGTPNDGPCETNDDCTGAAAPYCDGFTGCVECVLDDHCADGQDCEDHTCITPQACSTSPDCTEADRPVCNYVLGECAECVIGSDCGDSHICNQGTCETVTGCVNSLDCAEGTVCDRELAYCVECIADGDCLETETCVNNACIPRCDSDKDCTAAGELCNGEAGYCVECVENVDCPELYHCDQGSCNVDICIAGESTCDDVLNGRHICETDGASTYLSECIYGTTCTENGNYAQCTPWVCQPGTANCSSDGTTLEICGADGLGSMAEGDCTAAGGICENAACVQVVCEAGLRFCDGSTVMQCSDSGTSFTSINVCPAGQHCDEAAQGCTLNVCSPSTNSCDGNVVKTCNETGSAFVDTETDCEDDGKVCFQGACVAKVCEPPDRLCSNDDAYSCVDNGSRIQLFDNCNSTTEYCEDGECKARACTPGQPACDGEVAGTCDALGKSIDTSAGTDCSSLTDKVCWNGACVDQICDPAGGFCQGQSRYNCTNNGSGSSLISTCSASYYCNDSGVDPVCTARICTANSPACDGNRATTCNANGSGYETGGTTCDSDEQCVSGTCLPVICTPNAYYCQNGSVQRCGADGTTSQLWDTCYSYEYCEDGVSTCRADVCSNGAATCDGELVTTCAADGSGPLPGGTSCPEGQTCDSGACAVVFCTPGNEYCDGNYRRTCNATGTGYSSSTSCGAGYYCTQLSTETTACHLDICSPSSSTCDGETLATCASDGGSYTSPGTDCGDTNQLCDGTGCVDTLTETVGGITTSTSSYCNNYRLGNRYRFASARTLTEIRQYLNITGTSQVTWLIYELDSATNPGGYYDLVFEKLTTSTGLQYHSSGTIDFTVDPDKHYVIGVRVAGTCTAYYANYSKTYLASGGYFYGREYESDSSTIDSQWYFSTSSYAYGQQLVFE